MDRKPILGIFSFTCCQGCQFTILYIENILNILKKFDVQYFHLLKEKNRDAKHFDLAIIEGCVSSKREIKKIKIIRKKSDYVIAIGACATTGGIPAMANKMGKKEKVKYVYNQKMLVDSIDAQPIKNFIKVDKELHGCPIVKEQFVKEMTNFLKSWEGGKK